MLLYGNLFQYQRYIFPKPPGYGALHIVNAMTDNDRKKFKVIIGKFSLSVFVPAILAAVGIYFLGPLIIDMLYADAYDGLKN